MPLASAGIASGTRCSQQVQEPRANARRLIDAVAARFHQPLRVSVRLSRLKARRQTRRAACVSKRVLSVSLTNLNRLEPRANARRLIDAVAARFHQPERVSVRLSRLKARRQTRRAACVSKRVLSVSLTNVNRLKPRANARRLIDAVPRVSVRLSRLKARRQTRRAACVSKRVLSVALTNVNRLEPRANARRLIDAVAARFHQPERVSVRLSRLKARRQTRRAACVSKRVLSVALTNLNRLEPRANARRLIDAVAARFHQPLRVSVRLSRLKARRQTRRAACVSKRVLSVALTNVNQWHTDW